jgi:FAD/FMN-containing dehydrogenase
MPEALDLFVADDADVAAAIAGIVGDRNVILGAVEQEPYVVDWRARYHGRARCVVKPGSTDEVARLVRFCAERRIPIVPQGGNTGMCGAATPDREGKAVVLRLDRLDRIRELDLFGSTITVEAGCVLADIQAAAAAAERLFPLSLGAEGSCQIGGNISTNAGGVSVLRYGTMRELVLGLEAVLPDGSVFERLLPLRKDSTGYDLKQVLIGAEGTLGVITAAVLKLFPLPRQSAVAMVALRGVAEALELLALCRTRLGECVSSFEIMSASQVDLVLKHIPQTALPFAAPSPWYLLIEATDTLQSFNLSASLEDTLAEAYTSSLITDATVAMSETQAAALWRIRHSVSEANQREGRGVSHDTAVPVARQAEFAASIEECLTAAAPDGNLLMVGHIGDGNIHVVVVLDRERYADDALYEATAGRINAIVDEVTLRLGGTISAEHGVGLSNKRRLAQSRSPGELALMRGIKRLLDPRNIMNPGKLFDLAAVPYPPDETEFVAQ